MKLKSTIRNLLLALLLGLPATQMLGQWTEVQKNWNSTAGSSPATTTMTLTGVASGDIIIASVEYLGTATGFTMTLSDGTHSFTQTPNSPCTYSTGQKVWLFYLITPSTGNITLTATPSVAHGISVHAIEFKPDTTDKVVFDSDICAAPTSGTTPINTPTITPAKSGVLYSAAIDDPASTGSITGAGVTGWTLGTNGTIASDIGNTGDEYQFSATGATATNFVTSGSSGSGWVAMAMSMYTSPQPTSVKGQVFLGGKVTIK